MLEFYKLHIELMKKMSLYISRYIIIILPIDLNNNAITFDMFPANFDID